MCVYTDAVLIVTKAQQAVVDTFLKLTREAEEVVLIVNESETKFIKYYRNPSSDNKIEIGNAEIESFSSFKYLGATLNPITVLEEEMKQRTAAENRAYYMNRELLTSKLLYGNTGLRLYNTVIKPVLTFMCM
jgi:hypothetical protein